MRQLSLSFGVYADYLVPEKTSVLPLRKAISRLVKNDRLKPDDLVIILAGHFGANQGASFIDYVGAIEESQALGIANAFLGITMVFSVLAVVGRKRQIMV